MGLPRADASGGVLVRDCKAALGRRRISDPAVRLLGPEPPAREVHHPGGVLDLARVSANGASSSSVAGRGNARVDTGLIFQGPEGFGLRRSKKTWPGT